MSGLNALGAGLHCSMARSKSRSQRLKINSNTERLRCGNNCDNISMALSDTAGTDIVDNAKDGGR